MVCQKFECMRSAMAEAAAKQMRSPVDKKYSNRFSSLLWTYASFGKREKGKNVNFFNFEQNKKWFFPCKYIGMHLRSFWKLLHLPLYWIEMCWHYTHSCCVHTVIWFAHKFLLISSLNSPFQAAIESTNGIPFNRLTDFTNLDFDENLLPSIKRIVSIVTVA